MVRFALQIGLVGLAMALSTAVLGWWTVPALGFAWGTMTRREERPALVAAAAAGLGWGLLLAWTWTQGPVGELVRRASGVLATPRMGLIFMTLGFPIIVAWAAAVVGTFARVMLLDRSARR